ncbi:STAS domain-containing protein [Streptomyces sp. NPDC050549]|uniref:STAS domain-containing protein n=1 Tax=Streptomyces sp. NPDC050549 TaxID=3155406 RepID=UPI003422FE94
MSEPKAGPPFAVHHRRDGRRQLIELYGEIDVLAVPSGSDLLDDTPGGAGADAEAVVDLRDVTFIDGSGLDALLRTAERLRARGHTLAVVVTNPFHRRLLHLVDLGPNVTLHTAVPEADRTRAMPGPLAVRAR